MNIPFKRAFSRFRIQSEVVFDIGTYNVKSTKFDTCS